MLSETKIYAGTFEETYKYNTSRSFKKLYSSEHVPGSDVTQFRPHQTGCNRCADLWGRHKANSQLPGGPSVPP